MPRAKKQHLKRRPDGRYACRYMGHWCYGNTEAEAFAAREAYKIELARASVKASYGVTVEEYAPSWLKVHKASVDKNTYDSYERHIRRLIEAIGNTPMNDVTPSDIKDVYNQCLDKSDSTLRKMRMLYVGMWDNAIEDGLVETNPCRSKGAQPHKGTEGSHRALTEEEDKLILELDERLRLAVLVMRYAGLRRGEVMAFDVDKNVDFDNNVIHVQEAIRFIGNKSIIVSPKTEAGVRDIPLFSILKNELKDVHGKLINPVKSESITTSGWQSMWEHYKQSAEHYMNGCYHYWYGRTKEHKELLRQGKELPPWRPFTVRPHDLRHSYCTMLRDAGVDMKLAIKWMGHADEKMILHIYDHITDKRTKSAISSVETNLKCFNYVNTAEKEVSNEVK